MTFRDRQIVAAGRCHETELPRVVNRPSPPLKLCRVRITRHCSLRNTASLRRSVVHELLSRKMSIYLSELVLHKCVFPLLAYNTVIWLPHTARDIDAIQCVQRRFTQCLRGYNRYASLETTKFRTQTFFTDLLWYYKIVFNVVDISAEEFFCHDTCSYTRGHPFKLFKKRPVLITMANVFSDRVVNV